MQDRYVGDAGDYAKYGLLRSIIGLPQSGQLLSLGVIWYRVANEEGNSDGKHISYLRDAELKACDPQLHITMAALVRENRRSLQAIEDNKILPSATFFSELVPQGTGTREARLDARSRWFQRATWKVKSTSVVFLDPDNGFEVPSVRPWGNGANKYVLWNEVQAMLRSGQSFVVYHHHNRTADTNEQIERSHRALRQLATSRRKIMSLTFRRGSVRSFFVIPGSFNGSDIERNVATMLEGPWGRYFSYKETGY